MEEKSKEMAMLANSYFESLCNTKCSTKNKTLENQEFYNAADRNRTGTRG